MAIFLSWSGERSYAIADALRNWLPDVFQGISVWMSGLDIDAGTRWSDTLNAELETSDFGVLCLTPENLTSSWLLFEAGCLAKAVRSSRVVPYRLGLTAADISYPLAQFQGVNADEGGTAKLVRSINEAREEPLSEQQVQRIFSKWWPDLKAGIEAVPPPHKELSTPRPDRALLEEILEHVRAKNPSLGAPDPSTIWTMQRTIYQVTPDDIRAMSTVELERYRTQLRARWNLTYYRGEEDYLEGLMRTADDELSRRTPA